MGQNAANIEWGNGRDQFMEGLVKHSVIGGTMAVIGGGKFANGAMMGAFQYLFNQAIEEAKFNALVNRNPLKGYWQSFAENVLASPAATQELKNDVRAAASIALSDAATATGGAAAAAGTFQVLRPATLPLSALSISLDLAATIVDPTPNWRSFGVNQFIDQSVSTFGAAAGVPPIILFGVSEGMKRTPQIQRFSCPVPRDC